MNLYLAPKRSIETNISKNSCFHDERSFWPVFPCILECVNSQGTLYNCVQAFATITLELFRAFFKDLWGCWKHKFLRKKGNLSSEEKILAYFSPDIEHGKCQGTVYKGSQGVLTIFVQIIWTFIWHLRGRQKQTFQKISVFTMKEDFGQYFLVL